MGTMRIGVAVTSLLAVSVSLHAANLVSDGGFEEPNIGDGGGSGFAVFFQGQTIGPWVVEANNVDVVGSAGTFAWQQVEGSQSVDMSGSPGAGVIYQDLTTVPGQKYRLRFAFAGNATSNVPPVKAMEVRWGDTLVDSPTFDVTGHSAADMGWTYLEYGLTAATDSTRLRFVSLIDTDGGAVIDDVSVTPVPEPAGLSIVAMGAAALLVRRRRRAA